MKRIVLSIIFCGVLSINADLLSSSENINLDFSDAVNSIQKVTQAAEPMSKHLNKGIENLNSLIDKVKGDPNLLNKSEFELAFAKHIKTLVGDIDNVLGNKQEIEWAFEDITTEVKKVIKRLDYNNEKMKEKISRRKEQINKLKMKLKKIAREIQRAGKNASIDIKREFKRFHRKYKLLSRTLKTQQMVQRQLRKTLAGLGANGGSFIGGAQDIGSWFDNLKDQRSSFISLAETHKDMTNLTKLVTSGGANSIISTFAKLRGIQGQLSKFNSTFEKMDSNLEVLQTFNPDDMSLNTGSGIDDGSEPWKEFLND